MEKDHDVNDDAAVEHERVAGDTDTAAVVADDCIEDIEARNGCPAPFPLVMTPEEIEDEERELQVCVIENV
jgi:hypothetical protein